MYKIKKGLLYGLLFSSLIALPLLAQEVHQEDAELFRDGTLGLSIVSIAGDTNGGAAYDPFEPEGIGAVPEWWSGTESGGPKE